MVTQLFIPKKCKVGINLRDDCYTKKLGYVIAHDGKKWRKEVSWESWRQKEDQTKGRYYDYQKRDYVDSGEKYGEEVRPIEFDNVPTSGFVLNKKVGGYKSDWNVRATYARVFDPRGFEFEINIVNLLYILEACNCMKGKGLEGEFVYSWDGKDLVLLPCLSWEYEKAFNFTKLQNQKFSAKSLVAGVSYKTKKEKDVVYVGYYPWYEIERYGRKNKTRAGKKYHIFTSDNGKSFLLKSGAEFIAQANTTEPVAEFAEIIEKFQNNTHSSKIVKFEVVPTGFDNTLDNSKNDWNHDELKKKTYFKLDGNYLTQYTISAVFTENGSYDTNRRYVRKYEFKGYNYYKSNKIDITSNALLDIPDSEQDGRKESYSSYSWSNRYEPVTVSKEKIDSLGLGDLFVTLESGVRTQVKDEYMKDDIYSI